MVNLMEIPTVVAHSTYQANHAVHHLLALSVDHSGDANSDSLLLSGASPASTHLYLAPTAAALRGYFHDLPGLNEVSAIGSRIHRHER